MIKRPGTENYLNKLVEEERKTYLEDLLDVNHEDGGEDEGEDEGSDGLIMMKKSDNSL